MSKTRRKFTAEFKTECVQFYKDNDLSFAEAAKRLHVSATSLSRWVQQSKIDEGNNPQGALTSEERIEFRRLKKEVRRLKVEADILKKAAAFFARDVL